MWNNSYRTPTERWQKTSDLPKGKKLPINLGRAKKKEKTETKEYGWDLHQWKGAVKEERFPYTRKPLHRRRLRVVEGGSCGATEQSAATGVRRAKQIPAQRIGADQHSPAREACLLTCRGGRGLGAEARASEVRSQGEDWGWLCEQSLMD